MVIHLVRHAHAGSRADWDDDDELRPLTDRGRAQSEAIADALEGTGIDVLWSSRYLRCRETLAPLGDRLGLTVLDHPTLLEGEYGPPALDALLAEAEAGRVVAACSHGDVIPAIVAAAVRRGADLEGPAAIQKAARYELTVVDGAVTRLVYVPRPTV
jgi:8-oxo-dGTP diphosphatase